MASEVIDPIYLPFSQDQLLEHFAPVAGDQGDNEIKRHLAYYLGSAERYREFGASVSSRKGLPLSAVRRPCQIEKDERFWVVACLMKCFRAPDPVGAFAALFTRAFGDVPPVHGLTSWEECLAGTLHLFFEVNLPSPPAYKDWLRQNVQDRHVVPYVLDAAHKRDGKQIRSNLEGPTHLDAMLLNEDNGFAVFWEAKVLSDVSHDISFDMARNQIARNVDVMLDSNPGLPQPLNGRDPARGLFTLLTPRFFKENPNSRHYGFLIDEYQHSYSGLARDIPHRRDVDWQVVAKRIGWLTFEDCAEVVPGACPWLRAEAGS